MIKYIVLCGPPGSGKSTVARELAGKLACDSNTKVRMDSFAAPMKHFIATALGEPYQEMVKDRARPELNGYSVRQFLIGLAETHVKKVYGRDIFARWLVHRSLRKPHDLPTHVVVDDGGFDYEIEAVPNRLVVNVYRPGKDFSSDSRSYYPGPAYTFYNKSDWAKMLVLVTYLYSWVRNHG